MKRRKSYLLLIVLIVLLFLPGVALAAQVDNLVVRSGEVRNDNIVLLDGDLEIEAGATVNGDVTIFSGDALVAGTVNGNVVLFDGDLDATTTAVINGECVIMSGEFTDNTATGFSCTNFEQLGKLPNAIPSVPPIANITTTKTSGAATFFGNVMGAIFSSIFLGLIAFAVATVFPNHFTQVENAVQHKPVASGTVGFLTSLAIPVLLLLLSPVLVLLAFVCGLGILLTLAVLLGLAGAIFFGWFVVGDLLGKRIAERLNLKNRTLPVTTAVGTAALTLGLGLLGAIPFFIGAELVGLVIACVGLGAVALTKFGTKPYPPLVSDAIRILEPENREKTTAVLATLPEDDDPLN